MTLKLNPTNWLIFVAVLVGFLFMQITWQAEGTYLFDPVNFYPKDDCGKNTFIAFIIAWLPGAKPVADDCHIKRVWSDECVQYWKTRYTLRDMGYGNIETIAELEAMGIEFRGTIGYWDQVIHDLEYNLITCP